MEKPKKPTRDNIDKNWYFKWWSLWRNHSAITRRPFCLLICQLSLYHEDMHFFFVSGMSAQPPLITLELLLWPMGSLPGWATMFAKLQNMELQMSLFEKLQRPLIFAAALWGFKGSLNWLKDYFKAWNTKTSNVLKILMVIIFFSPLAYQT